IACSKKQTPLAFFK
ncbi:bacterial DNA polymerase III alpha subunit, partial [Vibrio parahaemolyticus V-223/04]